ncbi:MAG: leucine-rich repeat protein, partial [Clostridia bacterium]|nr:leucine-rich repeat protein [Clostridia bacterium]
SIAVWIPADCNLDHTFTSCKNLTTLNKGFYDKLYCNGTFQNSSITTIKKDNFVNLISGEYLLSGCYNLNFSQGSGPDMIPLKNLVNGAHLFDGSTLLNFVNFEFDKLTDANYMFSNTKLKNISCSFSILSSCDYMFENAELENVTLNFNILTSSFSFFKNAKILNNNIITMPKLKYSEYMFYKAYIGSNLNFPLLEEGNYMFKFCNSSPNINLTFGKIKYGNNMFNNYYGVLNYTDLDFSELVEADNMFGSSYLSGDITFDAPKVISCSHTFQATKITSIDLNIPLCKTADFMFQTSDLKKINIINNRIENAEGMFYNCILDELDVSRFQNLTNLTDFIHIV